MRVKDVVLMGAEGMRVNQTIHGVRTEQAPVSASGPGPLSEPPLLRSTFRAMVSGPRALLLGAAAVSVIGAHPANAQDGLPALGGRPSQTALQSTTGQAVLTTCVGFANNSDAVTAQQQDLFDRCTDMVESSVALDAGTPPAGLTEAGLNAALQQVATEETVAPGTLAQESIAGQLINISTRLAALRAGASGLSLSGLNMRVDGQTLAGADSWNRWWPYGERGGAAGDETGTRFGGRLGAFVNGVIETGEKDETAREAGFDFDRYGITAGVDYRFTDNLVLGAALGYTNLQTDFERSPVVAGGEVEADGFSIAAYGTYYITNFYVDGILSYGQNDYDFERRIAYSLGEGARVQTVNRTATASTDDDQFSASVSGGYDIIHGTLTYGPYLRLSYLDVNIDGYRERGADGLDLRVEDQDIESLTSALGARVSQAFSRAFGVVTLQGRAEWIHEFEDDDRTVAARFVADPRGNVLPVVSDDPDSDYFTLGIGASAVFQRGTQAFIDYETVLGLKDIEDHVITAGVRLEF